MLPQRLAILNRLGLVPTWAWDARNGALPSGATFTRASAGWYFNSAGVLVQAGTNVARFASDPVARSPLGYVAEPQSTNLVLNSSDLTNVSWVPVSATVASSAVVAPDGTTMTFLQEDTTATTTHFVRTGATAITFVAGTTYTLSMFARAGTRNWAYLSIPSALFGGTTRAYFNLATGVVGTITGTATSAIKAIGNGIYRISMTATCAVGGSSSVNISLTTADNTPSYSGDGVSGLYVWGAQVETNSMTSYIPTTGSTATRSADALTLPLASVAGWNASQGGVLVASYILNALAAGTQEGVLYISDGTANNLVGFSADTTGTGRLRTLLSSGGVSSVNANLGNISVAGVATKFALGWSTSEVVGAMNGSLKAPSTGVFSLPVSPTRLNIGCDSVGANPLNGTLATVAYYSGARSESFVQGVSR